MNIPSWIKRLAKGSILRSVPCVELGFYGRAMQFADDFPDDLETMMAEQILDSAAPKPSHRQRSVEPIHFPAN
jgi:hypothetical protein